MSLDIEKLRTYLKPKKVLINDFEFVSSCVEIGIIMTDVNLNDFSIEAYINPKYKWIIKS